MRGRSWTRRWLGCGLVLLIVASAWPAEGQYYRFVDERGVPHYVEGIDNVPERFRSRAVPLEYRRSPPPTPAPPTGAPGATGSATIRYTPGERITVEALINGATSARLLLDTGADRTLISPRTLVAAGVSLAQGVTAPVLGVGGTADAPQVPITSLEVGEARMGPMRVVALDLGQPGLDGLLGRDFLDQFRVTLDAAAGVVTIAPR